MDPFSLALPTTGDFQQGGGISVQERASASAADALTAQAGDSTQIGGGLNASDPKSIAIAALVVFLTIVALRFAADKGTIGGEFSQIRFGVWNAIAIFLVLVLVVPFGKWVFGQKLQIPGFSSLVLAI